MLKEFDISSLASDPKGLQQLRYSNAKEQTPETLEAAAKQFESIFMNMMLKSMRAASSGLGDGIFDNDQSKLYQGMLDQQLSTSLNGGYSLGLAEALVRQLSVTAGFDTQTKSDLTEELKLPQRPPALIPSIEQYKPISTTSPPAAETITKVITTTTFETPVEFVRKLWPLAKQTGEKLEVSPHAILAQAALETGWGKSVIKHPDGSSSFNLFGIKANTSWQGSTATVLTLEYKDGIAERERAQFRSYSSYNESFDDYAKFLKENPRYAEVLKVGRSSQNFATALQDSGYATDPAYAMKIMAVMKNSAFSTVL
ncbi:MAG TPA: flagellar assembly peptidoglycan hydrolase FlgJ [Crenotrichaceae bacterium]|nr:flagellar assembly peptidoglycan hydrolase FlgJ [Crenotrichaceae bacterium]